MEGAGTVRGMLPNSGNGSPRTPRQGRDGVSTVIMERVLGRWTGKLSDLAQAHDASDNA